ncbi:Mov34/MPN/PAD-1 family protein [Silvibacterium dinghuense]|uniref:M67 family peptidase n=1 Tax=Silvibacterium dinghuense TaxID=1560006 RepID=A0A4Q1SI58_9BACT|nr:M67 family metallopeptidase [Silvibacterium dinghuense]RXS97067.1 M67 family peptidase [Silvibacterium dinghuense]GGG95910.1 Mov34/MPN/PAD-1 family protein [Silvibacterium dinghuense]
MLKLNEQVYDAIRRHGEETYPHECCGVLLGRSSDDINEVADAVRAGNTRTDSAHNRYHIAPQELVKIQRQGRERGLDIVGFYHSHPDHPAQWSKTDFAEAHWLGCSYVITAVAQGVAQQTNSFLLTGTSEEDKAFLDEAIVVANDAAEKAAKEPAADRC